MSAPVFSKINVQQHCKYMVWFVYFFCQEKSIFFRKEEGKIELGCHVFYATLLLSQFLRHLLKLQHTKCLYFAVDSHPRASIGMSKIAARQLKFNRTISLTELQVKLTVFLFFYCKLHYKNPFKKLTLQMIHLFKIAKALETAHKLDKKCRNVVGIQ